MAPTLRVRGSSDSRLKKLQSKEPLYKLSENVLCKFGGQLYDAIILEIKHIDQLNKEKQEAAKSESAKNKDEDDEEEEDEEPVRSMIDEEVKCSYGEIPDEDADQFVYYLHYRQWSSNWDEWVRSDCLVPISDMSRQQQKDLKMSARKDKVKKSVKRKKRRGRKKSALSQSQNRESDDEGSQMYDSSNIGEMDLQLSNPTQQSSQVIVGGEEDGTHEMKVTAVHVEPGESETLKSGDSAQDEDRSSTMMSPCAKEGSNSQPINDQAEPIDDSKVASKDIKPVPRKRGRKPKKKSNPAATIVKEENKAEDKKTLKEATGLEDTCSQNNESEAKIIGGDEGENDELMTVQESGNKPKIDDLDVQSSPKDGETKDDLLGVQNSLQPEETEDNLSGVQNSLKREETEDDRAGVQNSLMDDVAEEEDPICSIKGTLTVNDALAKLQEYFVSFKSFEAPLSDAFVKTIGEMFESYCKKVASPVVKAKAEQVMLSKGVTMYGDVADYTGIVALLDLLESGEWTKLKVLADTHDVANELEDLQMVFQTCREYVDAAKSFLSGKGSVCATKMEKDTEA